MHMHHTRHMLAAQLGQSPALDPSGPAHSTLTTWTPQLFSASLKRMCACMMPGPSSHGLQPADPPGASAGLGRQLQQALMLLPDVLYCSTVVQSVVSMQVAGGGGEGVGRKQRGKAAAAGAGAVRIGQVLPISRLPGAGAHAGSVVADLRSMLCGSSSLAGSVIAACQTAVADDMLLPLLLQPPALLQPSVQGFTSCMLQLGVLDASLERIRMCAMRSMHGQGSHAGGTAGMQMPMQGEAQGYEQPGMADAQMQFGSDPSMQYDYAHQGMHAPMDGHVLPNHGSMQDSYGTSASGHGYYAGTQSMQYSVPGASMHDGSIPQGSMQACYQPQQGLPVSMGDQPRVHPTLSACLYCMLLNQALPMQPSQSPRAFMASTLCSTDAGSSSSSFWSPSIALLPALAMHLVLSADSFSAGTAASLHSAGTIMQRGQAVSGSYHDVLAALLASTSGSATSVLDAIRARMEALHS